MGHCSWPLSMALPLTNVTQSLKGGFSSNDRPKVRLSPLTFGLPALLVTSLRSFTVP